MTDHSEIDVDFNFFDDTPDGKDPDSHSPTLRRYHQLLWSKELPDGRPFNLESRKSLSPYLVYQSETQRFVLGSDTIATRHRKKLSSLFAATPSEETDAFLRRSYTICGFIVFPVSRGSINQRRGTHPKIQDRWDLTLESIRRYYNGRVSPLTEVLESEAAFFDLFGSFEGYVAHFHLDDFVFPDGAVRFLFPFADFAGPTLPTDVDSYREYLQQSLALFAARRDRLQRIVRGHA